MRRLSIADGVTTSKAPALCYERPRWVIVKTCNQIISPFGSIYAFKPALTIDKWQLLLVLGWYLYLWRRSNIAGGTC
jgi:hypothetical protein